MATRTPRRGVSGNPARRAQAAGRASAGSPEGARRGRQSYVLGAALVVVALMVLLVPRPGGDEGPSGTAQDGASAAGEPTGSAAPQVQTTGAPREATDEAFCEQFVAMANVQGEFISNGETRPDLLEQAADDLVAVGVPASMSLPARTGYFNVISGVYDSIGLGLAPAAVGAAPAPVEGSDVAFTAYLDQYCPA
ncbi:hypothetical protein GCM10023339_46120 [Alloalcanivorax gelatiniphagus]